MKEKLTALDLEVSVNELEQNLVGLRLNNIYNVEFNNKQFLLKFQKPNVKQNLVIDCGLKLYITKFSRNTPNTPSGFIMKLRNFLSNKKLTGLKKIANERTIVFQFSNGLFYLALEFFSSGNLLVLDENLKILQVFRVNEEHNVKIGGFYNLFNPFELFNEASTLTSSFLDSDSVNINREYLESILEQEKMKINKTENTNNKNFKVLPISKLLYLNYPTLTNQLIQDKLKVVGVNPKESCANFFEANESTIESLLKALKECVSDIKLILDTDKNNRRGYLTKIKNPSFLETEEVNAETNPEFLYDSYSPFKPSDASALFDEITGGYTFAIDKFYSTLELLKTSTKTNNFISQQNRKLEQTKLENLKRVQQLDEVSVSNETKGNIIIFNVDIVEELIETIRDLAVKNQMDWKAIELWIQNQQRKRKQSDPIQRIKLPLKLEENKFNVLFPLDSNDQESDDDSESESDQDQASDSDSITDSDSSDLDSDFDDEDFKVKTSKTTSKPKKEVKEINIWIDFTLTAYNNASNYFQVKKELQTKKTKTLANQNKAMKSIEQKFNKNLNKKLKTETQPLITKLKEPFFFQKFNWFITTDGYLAILLNDDLIYWKYAEKNDFYLNSNAMIATKNSQVLIKNLRNEDTLSERAIVEISQFSLAGSDAWNKKISSASCYYCKVENISKFPNNDFEKNGVLDNTKFYIKDEDKLINLAPVQLVMGFGLMWRKKLKDSNIEYVEHGEETSKANMEAEIESEIESAIADAGIPVTEFDDMSVADEASESDADYELLVEKDSSVEKLATPQRQLHKSAVENALNEFDELSGRSFTRGLANEKKTKAKKIKGNNNDTETNISESSAKRLERSTKLQEKAQYNKLKVKRLINMKKPLVHYDLMLKELSPAMKLSNDEKEDELYDFEVVPMFAPWMALSKAKFKVKIQNGTNKKLKNCNDIMIYFENHMKLDSESKDKERIWPKELELLREYPTEALTISFFIDKFKCSLPGSKGESNGGNKGNKKSKGNKKKK